MRVFNRVSIFLLLQAGEYPALCDDRPLCIYFFCLILLLSYMSFIAESNVADIPLNILVGAMKWIETIKVLP